MAGMLGKHSTIVIVDNKKRGSIERLFLIKWQELSIDWLQNRIWT